MHANDPGVLRLFLERGPAPPQRVQCRLGPIRYVQFAEDDPEPVGHVVLGHTQSLGNLPVVKAFRHELQQLEFMVEQGGIRGVNPTR